MLTHFKNLLPMLTNVDACYQMVTKMLTNVSKFLPMLTNANKS